MGPQINSTAAEDQSVGGLRYCTVHTNFIVGTLVIL